MKTKITLVLLLVTSATINYAQPGTLDTTFGYKGKMINTVDDPKEIASAAAFQQNGKILIASSDDHYNDLWEDPPGFYLSRYNADGSGDYTFSGSGERTTTFQNNAVLTPVSLAVQSDQKIIESGSSANKILIARYYANGSLDKTFGAGNGKVVTNVGAGKFITITSTVVQADEKIVVGGYIGDKNKPGNDFYIARYNIDGTPDKTFGNNGSTTLAYGGDERATAMALQKDGKIIEVGYADNNSSNIDFAIVRFNTNGLIDLSFGYLVTTGLGGNDYGTSVAIQKNGKIVVAGYSEKNNDDDIAIARYNTNGTLDNTFAGNGKLVKGFGKKEYINSVAVQSNGKIIAGGYTYTNSGEVFLITRFKSNGILDSTFSKDGKVTANFVYDPYDGILPSVCTNVLIQPDGKIVCAGYSYTSGLVNGEWTTGYYTSIARYLGDASTFSESDMNLSAKEINVNAVSLQQNFPNPFTNTTAITYSLPLSCTGGTSAKIIITDRNGGQVKQINLSGTDKGTIQVDAATLVSGAYYYSLYVDGKLITTKQMVLTK